MTYDIDVYASAIEAHAAQCAADALGHLDRNIEHCPGWTVADLLQHLIEVHWFWTTIVEQRLQAPPETGRPTAVDRDDLVDAFSSGATRLVRVLRSADQKDEVYTWAPTQHNVAFVTRHQVQEMVVHHWDVGHAVGRVVSVGPKIASDSIDEFLTFSVSNVADQADPPRPPLGGPLVLMCSDSDASWTIEEDVVLGTVRFTPHAVTGAPVLRAAASDLLLWLYSRKELSADALAQERGQRLRALCFTD